jgi:hypothetical protein
MSVEHNEYAAGLRLLADWLEAHPEIPLPTYHINNYNLDTKEQAAELVRAFGSCKKKYSDDMFYVSKQFGVLNYEFSFYRSGVCTPRVVGVETIPAMFVEAHTIPARTKEIVEWDCEPILAPSTSQYPGGEDQRAYDEQEGGDRSGSED